MPLLRVDRPYRGWKGAAGGGEASERGREAAHKPSEREPVLPPSERSGLHPSGQPDQGEVLLCVDERAQRAGRVSIESKSDSEGLRSP